MRILQVAAIDITIEKLLLPLIDASIQKGDQVDIVCHSGVAGSMLMLRGYRIHHIPFSRKLNHFSHIMNVFRLVKLLRKEKYDIVHVHTPIAGILTRLAAKIARVPTIIYTAHGFYFHENMNPIVYKIAYMVEKIWGKLFTDYMFFQSKEDYELALANKFKNKDNLLHIGNGVSYELYNSSLYSRSDVRKQYGVRDEEILLIFVGRLVFEKGIIELVDAFKIIKEKHTNIKLMLVGGSVAGDRNSITPDEIISRIPMHLRDSVYLLGLRDDIPQLLHASDIFLLPSYREGMPRSIIEAMAMGKPIIATDIRGCREEVHPEYNGYLCKVKDSLDLADKISMLLNHPERIEQFGKVSREMYVKDFDESVVVDKQLKVFDSYRKREVKRTTK